MINERDPKYWVTNDGGYAFPEPAPAQETGAGTSWNNRTLEQALHLEPEQEEQDTFEGIPILIDPTMGPTDQPILVNLSSHRTLEPSAPTSGQRQVDPALVEQEYRRMWAVGTKNRRVAGKISPILSDMAKVGWPGAQDTLDQERAKRRSNLYTWIAGVAVGLGLLAAAFFGGRAAGYSAGYDQGSADTRSVYGQLFGLPSGTDPNSFEWSL